MNRVPPRPGAPSRQGLMKLLMLILLPLWLLFAFRHVFGGRWWALAARAVFASASYALLLVATITAGVVLLATGLH